MPFSPQEFMAVFAAYNNAVWPAQVFAFALGLAIMVMLWRPVRMSQRFIATGVAVMWGWTGIAYHALFFAKINPPALAFGVLFVLQAVLLLHASVNREALHFGQPGTVSRWAGWALLVYALALYPLAGILAGHRYPELPMFGITPCPVTLFTFGLLLLTTRTVPRRLLVIPFLWSLVGGSAAILLGMPQDWPLLMAGMGTTAILLTRDRARAADAAA